ncbi:MAG: class I SAM-dependent methyltransferase [Candidatus Krumholzibacteriota bacterium]|nr:class I SAM-dependent methyltransferase [Candidatus Krumholzibacteriota bacterium]
MDEDEYIQKLVGSNVLREPILRSVIEDLPVNAGSRGLDAGCGAGLQSILLAEAAESSGVITGLDLSEDFIHYAEKKIREAGFSDRILFQQGDIRDLPFDDGYFDWVWSADCAGYPTGDLLPILREFARVVRPGGFVAIMAWSSQSLLPGHQMLEARLNSSSSPVASYLNGRDPDEQFMRALKWFRRAGLKGAKGKTYIRDFQAPLNDDIREALTQLFEMLWGKAQPDASSEDRAMYRSLCSPGSPDFILNLKEYYAFFTYTVFSGSVMER